MNDKRTLHPSITLKNGLRVANFSSPHPFTFDDGSILPACPEDTVGAGKLVAKENITERYVNGVLVQDVKLDFELSESCKTLLFFLGERNDVDIVLVPLPVLQCIKNLALNYTDSFIERWLEKCRVVRVKDRMTKVIFSDKFCV